MKFFKNKYFLTILTVLVVGRLVFSCTGNKEEKIQYRTDKASRGDLVVTISATGTVEPEEVIDVGAQVAGQILSFGKDKNGKMIDYGSEVQTGMVLAQIDEFLYRSDVVQGEAQLLRAKADLLQTQAKLKQAERDWSRIQKIGSPDALAQTSFDSYQAIYEVAKAAVSVSEAGVSQAQAVLEKAQRNLGYCVIKSPVDGVIIDRRVNIGQTVVSSLNAPSLFLIAKDLKKIQVWVAVNEADIGSIKAGQQVKFTVDAFPGEVFEGSVGKVRLNASMTQNVVTYTVEVLADNSAGRLLPYLTANATFTITNIQNVLLVPNAALRFRPTKEGSSGTTGGSEKGKVEAIPASESTEKHPVGYERGTVWILEGGEPVGVPVAVGGTDGSKSEILSASLKEGDELIVGREWDKSTAKKTETVNPFAPTINRGGRRR